MSSASSPLVSRRRAANIPSDQRSLLEGQDSWAVDLRNQPHGLVHIPGHILEAAKAAHLAQKRKSQGQTPQSKKRSASPVASVSNKRIRNGIATTPKSNFERPPQSSPEKSIPWSPSPPRDQPKEADSIHVAVDTTIQSSIVHETPKTGSTRPTPLQRQRPSIPTFEHPPLSEESEDDMETRIPDAQPLGISINQSAIRSNRAVPFPRSTDQPMATPPCAQPSNSTQSSGPEKNGKVEMTKSRLVFKPIDVDDVGKRKKRNYPEKERLAPTIAPPVFDSSRPNSSDSFIPSTYKVPATQESIRESIEGNEDKDEEEERDNRAEVTILSTDNQKVVEKASSRRPVSELKPRSLPNVKSTANQDRPVTRQAQQQQAQQQRVQQPTTPTRMDPPKQIASTGSRKPSVNHEVARQTPSPAPSRIAPGAPREPFETFVQHYPEYASGDGGRVAAGTKLHFITACVYLNYLRSKNLLRDCMYDEFIRAFPRYYKEYVDETRRPAMVAIKWFNKQRDAPVFNKYLVHRGNLSYIMRMYPDEFIEVNEKILKKKEGDELSIYTSSEDEEEDEEKSSEEQDISSPVMERSDKKAQGASPPVASFESEMDKTLSEILPAHVSSSVRRLSAVVGKETEHEIRSDSTPSPEQRPERRPDQRLEQKPTLPSSLKTRTTTLQAQPESSRAQDIITQASPPPSPKIPEPSMLPPSSIPDPVSRKRDPRPSQYLDKLASKSRASLGSSASPTSTMHDERRRAKLLRHFRKSIGVDKPRPGANTRGARSSSGRSETGR
ncbi:hypothetical protein FSPOR_6746 [Fusarium sporotrichioides]|uniref:Uncharacterized protein n=1 Tax=Fusarium sporotrichioides TaxID=5514 RepID=A0A395S1T2_FUSSP|nr:hypothetical protein FSPOR_6746 [Fusarium sporotrichioides]